MSFFYITGSAFNSILQELQYKTNQLEVNTLVLVIILSSDLMEMYSKVNPSAAIVKL